MQPQLNKHQSVPTHVLGVRHTERANLPFRLSLEKSTRSAGAVEAKTFVTVMMSACSV